MLQKIKNLRRFLPREIKRKEHIAKLERDLNNLEDDHRDLNSTVMRSYTGKYAKMHALGSIAEEIRAVRRELKTLGWTVNE